jgi:hypothetical protein
MTTNNGTTIRGPSGPQLNALRAQARSAGVSEAEWAGKVGARTLEECDKGQVDRLFALAHGGEPRQSTAVAKREPGDSMAMERVLGEFGMTAAEAAVVMQVIGPELTPEEARYAVAYCRNHKPPLELLNKDCYAIKVRGRVQIVPAVDWTRAVTEDELDGEPLLEFCRKPNGDTPAVWLSLANFSDDDPPHAGRARGYRKDSTREIIFEALWQEFRRTENAWTQYPLHMFGISLERQWMRHACPATLRGLHMEQPPVEELEDAARVYMWAEAADHGYKHDDIHLMFGIQPEESLNDELRRRGMDWRDAVGFVRARIKGHGDLPELPPGLPRGEASMLYNEPFEPERAASNTVEKQEAANLDGRRVDPPNEVREHNHRHPSADNSYDGFRQSLQSVAQPDDEGPTRAPEPPDDVPTPAIETCAHCGTPLGPNPDELDGISVCAACFQAATDQAEGIIGLPETADGRRVDWGRAGLTEFLLACNDLMIPRAKATTALSELGGGKPLNWRSVPREDLDARFRFVQRWAKRQAVTAG